MTIVYLLITMNLLKRRSVVGSTATNLTNHHIILGLNIYQCTSVTKNRNTSQCSGLEYLSVHIRDEKHEYVAYALLFVMFSDNVAKSSSRIK
jgi:hypothetical protein